MLALTRNKLAAAKNVERGLDGALRETRLLRKRAQTGRDRFPFRARRLPVEMEINKICRRLTIVADDVPHQNVENVIVDRNGFAKPRHDEK